jgi:ELWxxDGT repeat protein
MVFEGNLYFSAYEESTGRELWRTNDVETTLVKDILPGGDITPGSGSSDPGGFTEFKEWLYFTTMTRLPGFRADIVDELWRTNGGVTEQVAFLDSLLDALPYDLANFDGNLYHSAFDSSTGKEVWRTDGMDVPYLFADVYPGDDSAEPPPYRQFTEFNGYLYFTADDGTTGVELWRTDGYETELVQDINKVPGFGGGTDPSFPEELTVFEGYLYFRATDDRNYHLWRTDGNETTQVTDINADTFGPSFYPSDLQEASGSLYFTANDGVTGREIWKTDGNTTTQVADIYPGDGWSNPRFYHDFDGYVYFQADDGLTGVELWRTDGIETTLAADLNPGSGSSDPGGSIPGGFYGFNNYLYFGANLGLWRLGA